MPGLPDNEDARRLAGFQRIVMQQSPYRMWHLRDELLQHVRTNLTSNVLNIGAGWLPVDTKQDAPVLMPAPPRYPIVKPRSSVPDSGKLKASNC